jgi:Ca-activated chloride channel family protein
MHAKPSPRIPLYHFYASLLILPLIFILSARSIRAQVSDDAALSNKKGLELYEAGRYEEAIAAYQQAVKLKKDYAEAFYNMGDAFLRSGEPKKAIEAYKQALRFKPDMAVAYNNLGTAYFSQGEYKKAINAFKEALKLNQKASNTYYNLGAAYVARGEKETALEQYKILKGFDTETAEKLYLLIYKPYATVIDSTGQRGVRLNVRVSDSNGNAVSNLRQEDFSVYENEVPQVVTFFSKEEAPIFYGLVVDNSGSFRTVIDLGIAASKIIVNTNRPSDETLLVRFVDSDKIETLQDFTANKVRLNKALESMFIEGGQTALLDAVYLSAQRVAQYKAGEGVYSRRAVILLTDDEERNSYYTYDKVVELLRKIDVQVFAIIFDTNSKKSSGETKQVKTGLVSKLAAETGGEAFRPKTTAELESVVNQLLNYIRSQYSIGYRPSTPAVEDKKLRRIEVRLIEGAGHPQAKVATRMGYLLPDKAPER